MKLRVAIAAGIGAVFVAIAAWTILASQLFVWLAGLSAHFPSPRIEWWRYARQPHIDGSTLAYLFASGIIAGLPILAVSGLFAAVILQVMKKSRSLYGSTAWANEKEMTGAEIRTDRSPF